MLCSNTFSKAHSVVVRIFSISTLLLAVLIAPLGPTRPVLDQAQWKDFQHIVTTVQLERPALVVASHGVDFLTTWHLNTHFVEEDESQPQTHRTYVLKENSSKVVANGKSADEQLIFENESFELR